MADPDTITGIWAQRLQHPITRALTAIAFALFATIVAFDLVSLILGVLRAPDWLINISTLIVVPTVAVWASIFGHRALKSLSEPDR